MIVQWANDKISSSGKENNFTSFSDKSLANSMAIFDLVDAIQPGSVDYSLIVARGFEKKWIKFRM